MTCSVDQFQDVSCYGAGDGWAQVSVTNGVEPFSYLWKDESDNTVGGDSALIENLGPGTYTVYITDSTGCQTNCEVTIDEPLEMTCSVDQFQDVSCYGAGDGWAQVSVTNGVEPFSYLWKDESDNTVGGDSALIENLGPGTYTVYITDSTGCQTNCEVTIDEPLEMTCSVDQFQDVSCYGAGDGWAQVSVTNGVEPFSYLWKDESDNTVGGDSALIENLGPGTYTVYITDSTGCQTNCEVTIDEPLEMTCSIDLFQDASCENGSMDGWAQVSVTNGIEPFSYVWKDSSDMIVATDSALAENLSPGIYTVYITDSTGCQTSCEITIGEIPCEITCETAYGMLEGNATCFIGDGFNNWGWTNLVTPSENIYILPLYAGAAQCDAGNGELVGSVEIDYSEENLIVKYQINEGYSMSEVHVYVGCEKYPVQKNGKETTAPGQYTHNSTGLDKVVEYTVLFENVAGPVYVIAHAVVCDVSGSGHESEFAMLDINCAPQAESQIVGKKNKSSSVEFPELEASSIKVYPNPFSEKVSFEFVSGKDVNAKLEITDMLGQRIAVLIDRQVKKGELNRVEFVPTSEVSGILIYRLFLGDQIDTGQLIYRKE